MAYPDIHSDEELTITSAVSFNHHGNYVAGRAHDGDYYTWYSVKDGAVAGNFLKLYLSRVDEITTVKMTSRAGHGVVARMVNTEVRVYTTEGGETEVASCGKITGKKKGNLHFYIIRNNHNWRLGPESNLV